jgi:hypothetical protein
MVLASHREERSHERIAMNDPRLNSVHLDLDPRRQVYRQAREGLLAARGWATLALEKVSDLAGDSDVWPALLPGPDQLLRGTKFMLIEPPTRRTYLLRPGLNTIGRFPDNDIVLEESAISHRHCVVLVHTGGQCELHDTASRNGTFVNGQLIDKPARLRRGDQIMVCRRLLVFVSEADCQNDNPNHNYPNTDVLD